MFAPGGVALSEKIVDLPSADMISTSAALVTSRMTKAWLPEYSRVAPLESTVPNRMLRLKLPRKPLASGWVADVGRT